MDWMAIKTAVAGASDISRDALHLLGGVGGHLILVIVLRSWTGALLPFGLVLVAAMLNEYYDLTIEPWTGPERGRQWAESVKDLLLTMAVPLVLLLLSRFAPRRLTRLERPQGAGDGGAAAAPDPLEVGERPPGAE